MIKQVKFKLLIAAYRCYLRLLYAFQKAKTNLMLGPELGSEKLFLATVAILSAIGLSVLVAGLALLRGVYEN